MTTYNRRLKNFKVSVVESNVLHFFAQKLRTSAFDREVEEYPPEMQVVIAGCCTGLIHEIERYGPVIKNANKDQIVLKLREGELDATQHSMLVADHMLKMGRFSENFDMDSQDLHDIVAGLKLKIQAVRDEA